MPIFEFECIECEQAFEHLQRSGGPEPVCTRCGTANVKRILSLCAVSSDASRAANLGAAHQKAAMKRNDKQRSEHAQNHDHFGDAAHK